MTECQGAEKEKEKESKEQQQNIIINNIYFIKNLY